MTNNEQIEALIAAGKESEYKHLNRNPLEPENIAYITNRNVNLPVHPMYRDYHALVSSSRHAIEDMYLENKRLKEALEFYADVSNWDTDRGYETVQDYRAVVDRGNRARQALQEKKGGE